MSELTPRERFMLAMRCKEVDRPPVCGMTTTATTELMEYANSYWPEAHKSARQMANIALGAYKFLGLESVRVPYCLSYEAEALGCTVDLGKINSTPMVKGSPYKGDPDANLELPDPKDIMKLGRNAEVFEAAKLIIKERKDDLPTLLGVTGPFTIAGHLAGTEGLILWTLTEPDVAHRFAKFAADYERMWLEQVETLGIDAIQMSEPTASYDMISPDMFDEFAAPNLRYVYEPLKETMQILHICGNMLPMLPNMLKSGATGCSLEEKTDSYEAVKLVNKRAALIGNVGVVKPLLMGTPEETAAAAIHSADAGFNIISAGCGMSALIKKENVWAMVNAIRNWKKP
ncbi:MAG: MtaA/CmuA family methyltransferase [Candidatus Methanomethylophilaceae archaeon]|nr:MtaA/CmuA family methyltransferase [Candidatus Methanomethylophilaceae archaeon]MDY5871720.1 MtaA/CmuA family methyltransferase [Candidatus Methanomethylophilaceae archaeon]